MIIPVIIAVLLIYFFVSMIAPSFSMVYVEPAREETVSKTLSTRAYIIRKESYVVNDTGGVLYYNVDDASAVEKGGVIAGIYENETDAINFNKINKLNTRIEDLKRLNSMSEVIGASLESINKSLNNSIHSFIADVDSNQFGVAEKSVDDFLYSINEKQIITGKIQNFNSKIAELENEKIILQQSIKPSIGQITADRAGIFTSHTDGFEESYDYAQAQHISYQELINLQSAEKSEPPKNVIGKIISDVNWRICCPVSAEEAKEFDEISGTVSIGIPYASTELFNAEVLSVNREGSTGNAVVVLECKSMDKTLAKIRNEQINISVREYSGIKIEKSSIHRDKVTRTIENRDGTSKTEERMVDGVYILYGNELRFKEIVKIYETDDFVICSKDKENEKLFSGNTVKLYDKIVTEGTDLYAGKIVKQSTEIE